MSNRAGAALFALLFLLGAAARIALLSNPGFEFDVVGVLVPQPGLPGTWQVRPRSPADVLERDP